MIILSARTCSREAERTRQLDAVFFLVRAVTSLTLGLIELYRGQRLLTCQLGDIVHDTILIAELCRLELAAALVAQNEDQTGIDHSLTLEHVGIVVERNIDIGKDLKVGSPVSACTGPVPYTHLI